MKAGGQAGKHARSHLLHLRNDPGGARRRGRGHRLALLLSGGEGIHPVLAGLKYRIMNGAQLNAAHGLIQEEEHLVLLRNHALRANGVAQVSEKVVAFLSLLRRHLGRSDGIQFNQDDLTCGCPLPPLRCLVRDDLHLSAEVVAERQKLRFFALREAAACGHVAGLAQELGRETRRVPLTGHRRVR